MISYDTAKYSLFKTRLDRNGEVLSPSTPDGNFGKTLTSERDIEQLHEEYGPQNKILSENEDKEDEDEDEVSCGDCYGAGDEGECCNSCEDVKAAYQRHSWSFNPLDISICQKEKFKARKENGDDPNQREGCRVHGSMTLPASSGNFHFAPHIDYHKERASSGVYSLMDLLSLSYQEFNVSHTIHSLSFGPSLPYAPSLFASHTLNGQTRVIQDMHGMMQYYLKLVPTVYKNPSLVPSNKGRKHQEEEIRTFQFSVTEHVRHLTAGSNRGLPGVYFFYEVSPIQVEILIQREGFWRFLATLCGLIGGVYTIFGLFERFLQGSVFGGTKKGKMGLGGGGVMM